MKRFALLLSSALLIGISGQSLGASCDPLPAGATLPVTVNGYTIEHKTHGTGTVAGPNGEIPLNGGLVVKFVEEHVGTVLEFLGGSVGDVD